MKKVLIAASILAASQFATVAAQAATCAERSYVIAQLENRFGETLQAVSAPRQSAVLEVYASRQTESWTVLLSFTRGLTCLVASGNGFETLEARYQPVMPTTLLRPVQTASLSQPVQTASPHQHPTRSASHY